MIPRQLISIISGCCIFLAALCASADGGFVSPEIMDLREPNQIGLIVHDGAREDLYLKVDFQEANNRQVDSLGWILAVPSEAEAEEASDQIFVDLMDLTRPYDDEDDDPFGMGCMGMAAGADNSGLGSVEILDKTIAGAFEITTVSAESAAPLRNWIDSQEFHLSEEADPILDFYIEKNWRFLTVRIDLEYARANGALKPLKLSFDTEKPVFPFRISAINGLSSDAAADYYDDYYYYDYDSTEVLLYLVSDVPLTASNRSVSQEFSQAFSAEDLDSFKVLGGALPEKGHITKVRFWSTTEEMDDDIYFEPAAKVAGMVISRGPRRGLHVYLILTFLGFAFIRYFRRGR